VWQDEFDGPSLDTTKWVAEIGGGGWGNAELETYTAPPANAHIDNGILVIEARHDSTTYTSTRLKTQGKASWTYARVEARIQIPRGQGIWPAFWMLGDNITSVGWPGCGEIDIMENIGREPARVHGTVHGPGYSGANGVGHEYDLASGAFADSFHVYAIEWEAGSIKWYVDGVRYLTVTAAILPGTWVFNHQFFILLNVAIGGYWPGNPDGTTTFPQMMRVDYVRVYQR
jgi:beta-glucanase (GH16 family)